MRAKTVEFEVTYIDLADKPDWFLEISPHGKVPVLVVDDQPLFESNAIAEFLDEEVAPRLHPEDAIKRARNRAWTDFVPSFAESIREIYYAAEDDLPQRIETARQRVAKLEGAIAKERGNDGPFFNGDALSLVDCAYAPFLQRFRIIDAGLKTGLLDDAPLVRAWSDTLAADERVIGSVADSFLDAFIDGLRRRGAHAARFLVEDAAE